jgi:4-hydroxy-tetrahydrodipicolinate synthase
MLYNNPVAYKTDFLPAHIVELARELPNLQAVKESSTDVRRTTAIRALLGGRISVLCGVDDAIVEAIGAGALGWIAGLVNAVPAESVALFRYAAEGRRDEAFALYRWFLPLLRMDTVPKFVQLIKLAQERVGMGTTRVRGPRLPLAGEELREANAILDHALATRPALAREPVRA